MPQPGRAPFVVLAGGPLHSALRLVMVVVVAARWGAAPLARAVLRRRQDPDDLGRRLRFMFEQLGATYVKLGQFLAARFDILPTAIYQQMQLLFDSVRPVPLESVRRVIREELGCDPEDAFDPAYGFHFVASASIALVYRARLADGQIVAVKVQRPGIEAVLRADFRLLRMLAWLGDLVRALGEISISGNVESFIRATLREVDFTQEGLASERVARSANPGIAVPTIFWELTTRRVLTMEFIEGVSIQAIIKHLDAGHPVETLLPNVDLREVVDRLADESLSELYQRGFFHADPHPGNFIVKRDGTIALVDFGIFGELQRLDQRRLARFFECLASGDVESACRYFISVSSPTPWTDMRRYRRELTLVLSDWHEASIDGRGPLVDRHPARPVGLIADVMRRNSVMMEPNLVLFWRCILTLHALGLRLPVDFQLIPKFREFFERTRTVESIGLTAVLSPDYALQAAALAMKSRQLARRRWRDDEAIQVRTEDTVAHVAASRQRAQSVVIALALLVLALILSGW